MTKPYYEHKGITIYHGNCLDILPELPKFDLVLTDPPYGINVDSVMHKQSGSQYGNAAAPKGIYINTNWDNDVCDDNLIQMIIKKGKYSIIFGGNYFNLPPSRCWLVWDKINGDNQFADAELAWSNFDKPVRLKKHLWNGMLRHNKEERYGHPTQKPLAVIVWCIKQAPENTLTILDPFMGSGTTLRAAKDLGRKAIGVEMEERYCEIAAKRLSQEVLF